MLKQNSVGTRPNEPIKPNYVAAGPAPVTRLYRSNNGFWLQPLSPDEFLESMPPQMALDWLKKHDPDFIEAQRALPPEANEFIDEVFREIKNYSI